MPVQARSTLTVEAICEATVQVLVATGSERLTTTRVAERAGVSVGTLYQYFPNKHALMAAVLRRYLTGIVEAVEGACVRARGLGADDMARLLVDAFFDAKFADPQASRALYAVSNEAEGAAIVAEMGRRAQAAVASLLATLPQRPGDLATVSFVCTTALIGPVQGLLDIEAAPALRDAVREQLIRMVASYLRPHSARPHRS